MRRVATHRLERAGAKPPTRENRQDAWRKTALSGAGTVCGETPTTRTRQRIVLVRQDARTLNGGLAERIRAKNGHLKRNGHGALQVLGQ